MWWPADEHRESLFSPRAPGVLVAVLTKRFPVAPREVLERGLELLKERAANLPELLPVIEAKGPDLIAQSLQLDGQRGILDTHELAGERRAYVNVANDGRWSAWITGAVAGTFVFVTAEEAATFSSTVTRRTSGDAA